MACAVLLAVAAYVAVRGLSGQDGPMCTVRAADGADGKNASAAADGPGTPHDYELTPVQAQNAATIAAVAARRGLPERAVTIALATAMQESQLRNIGHGDRDSVGLFQQRPSQGWGTFEQIQDPVYSAGRFYDHLAEVPGYSRLPLTVAAQRVQRSGYPQAYAKHETDATLLTGALTGRRPATLSCTTGGRAPGGPGDPAQVRKHLVREFGRDVLADGLGTLAAPAPRTAGYPKARSAARPEAAPVVPVPAHGRRQGWELAHWAVANAERLRIERISYGGFRWSAERSADGWRRTDDAAAADGGRPRDGSGTKDRGAKDDGAKDDGARDRGGAEEGDAADGGGGAAGGTVELRLATGH
ncbi:heavy metal transporter [Streptomyces sp. AA1529]|uniref:heavy metal transporter n=1 Tax=Streptomyces sp. AA1529 TaxID=1203257 RepID=UPI003D730D8B